MQSILANMQRAGAAVLTGMFHSQTISRAYHDAHLLTYVTRL
jgi:hypothetical protein